MRTDALEWVAKRMRGKRQANRVLRAMVATLVGVSVLPLAQLPSMIDIGM